jgi:hypothetical protein
LQALASNNLERVASTMDQFERQFENLDVQSQFVEGAMNNQASLSTPEEDVNMLLQQVHYLIFLNIRNDITCSLSSDAPCLWAENESKIRAL